MSSNKKRIFIIISSIGVVLTIGIIVYFVLAGNPNPPGVPAPTMYTLNEIYACLTKGNCTSTEGGHSLLPTAAPASSTITLSQLWQAIPWHNPGTASPNDVCNSKTFYATSNTMQTGTRERCKGSWDPQGTATPDKVRCGVTFYGSLGTKQTGSYCPFCEYCSSTQCVFTDSEHDYRNDCPTSSTVSLGCATGNCNGQGGCGYFTSGDGYCPQCYKCDGSGLSCTPYADGEDDGCGFCKVCDGSGSCRYETQYEDYKNDCPDPALGNSYTGNCDGSGHCGVYAAGEEGNCPVCQEADGEGGCRYIPYGGTDTVGTYQCKGSGEYNCHWVWVDDPHGAYQTLVCDHYAHECNGQGACVTVRW